MKKAKFIYIGKIKDLLKVIKESLEKEEAKL